MLKWIGIALLAIVLIVLGVAFYVHHRVTTQAAKPLDIPDVIGKQEVTSSLKRRIQNQTHLAPAGTPPAQADSRAPETISLTGEELTLMVSKLLPPIEGLKMAIDIVDGVADFKLSMPSKELIKHAGDELGAAKSYIQSNVAWVNIAGKANLSLGADGKLAIKLKQVTEPSYLDAKRLQPILDDAFKGGVGGPVIVPLGECSFKLIECELDGNIAICKVLRLPPEDAHSAPNAK